jgi:hypothetical protein
MALTILAVFLLALVSTAVLLHYGFTALGLLPGPGAARSIVDRSFFTIDYTLFLNLFFLAMSAVFLCWKAAAAGLDFGGSDRWSERFLLWLALGSFIWLVIGAALPVAVPGTT